MRLARLRLDRYGAFSDLDVSFGPALTVVYGPNEAGKSTLLHAIGDVLWGLVPRQHPYAFEVAPSRLQVTADIDGAAGRQTLAVTGRGWRSTEGEWVQPWWADGPVAGRAAWDVGFGIDRERLREGGRAVLRDGGDLADLLFQARTGINLAAARARLLEEADAIWRRHRGARTVSLRATKDRADGISSRLAAAIHAADMVADLEAELQQAERDLETARAAHARATTVKEAAQRDERAYRFAVRLAGIRKAINELTDADTTLNEAELQRYEQAATALEATEGDLHGLDADLAELDATPLPPLDADALAVAHLVDELRRGDEAETRRRERTQELHGKLGSFLRDLRGAAADLDPALALADEAALRQEAPALMQPADVVDLLDRLAEQVAISQRVLADAAEAMQQAEAELLPSAPGEERGAHRRWEEARRSRDRAWQSVREPWLSGELPAPGVRATLASDLDGALATTDFAAVEAAAEAEEYVEAQTRAEERRRRLETARRDHQGATEAHAKLLEQWQLSVRSCGLPEALDPAAWRVRCDTLKRASDLLSQLADIDAEARKLTHEASEYHERVAAAVGPLGIDPADPLAALAVAYERVADAREAKVATAERDMKRSVIIGERAKREAIHQQAKEVLSELAARADGDLDGLVSRSRRLLDLQQSKAAVVGELRAAAPNDDPDDLAARLAALSEESITEAVGGAEDGAKDALSELEARRERRARLAEELKEAKEDRDAAMLRQQQVEALDEMAELARRWVKLQLMAGLIDQVLRADGSQADTALLEHARLLAGALTGGRVQGLSAAGASGDRQRLVVHLSGDRDAEDGELSEGTTDQVYLALRLAGIRQRQEAAAAGGSDTLPVVLDDVLMAHDDARTQAALRLLVGEASDQQIVLFTHHRAVAEAAESAGATVVTLGPPPDPSDRRPVSAPARSPRPDGTRERAERQLDVDPAQVRAWARAHGFAVGERGRIPGEITAAYLAPETLDAPVGD